MSLIQSAINRPTAVLMFFLAILVTGFMSLYRLPLELTPEVDYPKLSVTTNWFNSSAEMVEAYVTSPIEAVAQTLTDIHKVSSVSSEGQSRVDIELIQGANTDFISLELVISGLCVYPVDEGVVDIINIILNRKFQQSIQLCRTIPLNVLNISLQNKIQPFFNI